MTRERSGALGAFKEADIKFFTEKYKKFSRRNTNLFSRRNTNGPKKRVMLQNRLGFAPPAVWLSGAALTHIKWQIPVLAKISIGELNGGGGNYEITNVANMKSQM